jgi:L,D-peptidoglycan transpeptidase YkuD (ErfK/YbiS/YcfS/YnhG family)
MAEKLLTVKARADGPSAIATLDGMTFECVIGKNGAIAASEKREGDSKTPLGMWPLVAGFYRPDRVDALGVCQQPLERDMGWCDSPFDQLYNAPCDVGYEASHETLWREDAAYNYIGVMDYNLEGELAQDGQGLGSAIFLHVWREGAAHTEGCVALREAELEAVLAAGCDAVEIILEQ